MKNTLHLPPAFCLSGYSGAGKTTLIVALVRALAARGLQVGVVKHDAHGLSVDREGKDTDLFFKAGADVLIQSPAETFLRLHDRGPVGLHDTLRLLGPHFDLLLVEGHKSTPLEPKVWLCGEGHEPPPAEAVGIRRVLRRDEDREAIVLAMIDAWLSAAWLAPVYAGILVGGESRRMGRPKQLLPAAGGGTWVEQAVATVAPCAEKVVLLGGGELPAALRHLPRLPDAEEAQGPLRGMLSAMRWAPFASWLFVPCDVPALSAEALRWLLSHRRPGVRAVLPRLPATAESRPEPLPGWYDFRSVPLLARCRGPIDLAADPRVATPVIPAALVPSWQNVNTPDDLQSLSLSVSVSASKKGKGVPAKSPRGD